MLYVLIIFFAILYTQSINQRSKRKMLRQRGKSSKTPASGQKRTATKVPSPKPRLTALNLESALKRIQQRTNQSNVKSDLDLVGVAIGCTTDHDNLRSDTICDALNA